MGQTVSDPAGLEGQAGCFDGLGLMPIGTHLLPEKIVRQRTAVSTYPNVTVQGYEIHQGRSEWLKDGMLGNIFEPLFDDGELGMVNQCRSVWGTYLHGIFDSGAWRRAWLNEIRVKKGLAPLTTTLPDYAQQREAVLDQLSDTVFEYLDLRPILGEVGEKYQPS
jgi:adenosylcobyric acid synthase